MSLRLLVLPEVGEDRPRVHVGDGVVGIEPQRLGVMSHRVLVPPLFIADDAHVEVCQIARVCPMGQRMGRTEFPCRDRVRHWFRVMAVRPRSAPRPIEIDPDGTPGCHREDMSPEPAKTGRRQHDRAQRGHVAIAIRGKLVADPNDARVGRQDHQVTQPGRQQSGPAPAQQKQAGGDRQRGEDAQAERESEPIQISAATGKRR